MANIDYYRFSPKLSKDVELNEIDDVILLEMLCDVRRSIINQMGEIKRLAKVLLGGEELWRTGVHVYFMHTRVYNFPLMF